MTELLIPDFIGCSSLQGGVGPLLVVEAQEPLEERVPLLERRAGQIGEIAPELILDAADGTLDDAVLVGFSLLDAQVITAFSGAPVPEAVGTELWSVVGADGIGYSEALRGALEVLDESVGREGRGVVEEDELTGVLVDGDEQTLASAGDTDGGEVDGPDVVGESASGSLLGVGRFRGSTTRFGRGQSELEAAVDAPDALVVDVPAFASEGAVDTPVAPRGVLLGELLDAVSESTLELVGRSCAAVEGGTGQLQERCSPRGREATLEELSGDIYPFLPEGKFSLTTSRKSWISSSFSARIRLSLRFSSSRSLSLRICSPSREPYFWRQR